MTVIEKNGVITTKDKNGNVNIVMPVTTLENIETKAALKDTPANEDYFPIVDSQDGQMKKVLVGTVIGGKITNAETLNGLSAQEIWGYYAGQTLSEEQTTALLHDCIHNNHLMNVKSLQGFLSENKAESVISFGCQGFIFQIMYSPNSQKIACRAMWTGCLLEDTVGWKILTDTTYAVATNTVAGLMSASDKAKLDGIAAGANVNTITGIKGNSESTYRKGNVNLTAANIGAAAANHTHSYLPLAGGNMTGTANSSKTTGTYLAGNRGAAIINSTAAAGGYTVLDKLNSTNGYFTDGVYNDKRILQYTAKSTVDAGTNSVTKSVTLLDESGNSSFPGTVSAALFNGSASKGSWVGKNDNRDYHVGFTYDGQFNYSSANTFRYNPALRALSVGAYNTSNGNHSVAMGEGNVASNAYAVALGRLTTASGDSSFATGNSSTASGRFSTAIGRSVKATGYDSCAIGLGVKAQNDCAMAFGNGTTANYCQTVMGIANISSAGRTSINDTSGNLFIIGNGTSSYSSNALRITNAGKTYGTSSFGTSGADYAEYFEWLDGNPEDEDRRGLFVTVDGEKIKPANADDYILGVISAVPSVVGDVQSEEWRDRYLRDIFGEKIVETVKVEETTDENGAVIPAHIEKRWKINPDYDPEQEYISREDRKEWAAVGMMGKLAVVDDGTCQVNGYCMPKNGVATASETGYRVISRLDDTHVKVLLK